MGLFSTSIINITLIIADIIMLLQMYVMVFNGIYFSEKLEIIDIPLLRKKLDYKKKLKFNYKYCLTIVGFTAAAMVYTIILFKISKPNPSSFFNDIFDLEEGFNSLDYYKPNLLIFFIALKAGIVEEITYRFAYQNFFAYKFNLVGKKYIIAIFISTLLWTVGHTDSLDLIWVKYAQVFPFGIALGFIYKKWGLEASILSHGLFNILMVTIGYNFIF